MRRAAIVLGLLVPGIAQAITPRTDYFSTFVGVGSNTLVQSFRVANSVMQDDKPLSDSFVNRYYAPSETPPRPRQPTGISYVFGYTYLRSTSGGPATNIALVDDTHLVKVGLLWDLGSQFQMDGLASFQRITAENYDIGSYDLSMLYTFGKPASSPSLLTDSINSHGGTARITKARGTYPQLSAGFDFRFAHHQKGQDTSGRPAGGAQSGDVVFDQAASGPILAYMPSMNIKMSAGLLFDYYLGTPASLLGFTQAGPIRAPVSMALSALYDFQEMALVFPKFSVFAGLDADLSPTVSLNSLVLWNSYTLAAFNSSLSVGAVLSTRLDDRWMLGAGGDFTAAAVPASATLAASTGVATAAVTLTYLF